MKKYLGLRGRPLGALMIWAVIMPAYTLFGYNNGVAGGLLTLPSWVATFPRIDTVNTTGPQETNNSTVQGTVVAIYALGAFFGALSCIFLGSPLGRIRLITLGAFINFLGAVLQASSFSLGQLIVGRLVTGFGFGITSATCPNWQSECSKAEHRGGVVLYESLFISAGLVVSGWVNYGMSHVSGTASWRFPLALSGFFALLVILGVQFMPESPRWLIQQGHVEEARQVMAALDDVPEDSPEITAEVKEIEDSLELAGQTRFRDVLTNGKERFFHRTCIACAGTCFQQMCGINALGFYQTSIFETDLGLAADLARILGACVFTWQTICSPIGILTVDRFGRRKLMIVSAIGMGTCFAVIAGTASQTGNTSSIAAAAAFIFLFSSFFPVGFLGMAFLYAAEIAPLSARVPITALSTSSAWIFTFIVTEVTPVGFSTIAWRYFIVYACTNLLMIAPVVYFFFPETVGKPLEEIDGIFLQSHNIFDSVPVARKLAAQRGMNWPDTEGGKDESEAVDFAETR